MYNVLKFPVNQDQSMRPLLTEDEWQQIVVQWNQTAQPLPYNQCLHQIVEIQAESTPGATAIIFEESSLTYAQLNARANQLAHYLRRCGVGPEVLVGVAMERSLELVISLLGILKAGGAYVPLDPTYPRERLAFMLEDLSSNQQTPVLLLTQQRFLELFLQERVQLLCLDQDWDTTIAQEPENNPELITEPGNLAYVIYTSGSTGQPKGVLNTHRGICNRLLWMQQTYTLTPQDCVLQKTPFSFDVSVWEFFWPLLAGACLVLARPEGHKDSAYLVDLIQAQQITTLHFVPSMLQIFVEEPDLVQCQSIRQVFCSGEALPFQLQERFFARHPARLHNLYGPTEAAVDVSFWECQRQSTQQIVPIGHPIANMELYILDPTGQPVPIGVAGELHIGGVGLARGYLNRSELTAERFIQSPLHQETHRLYRTGDLARFLSDGAIEYLGRLDQQIKLRGFRIELGEIEAVLMRHPAIREAVVVVREDGNADDKRLVAYLVRSKKEQLAISEVQTYLQQQLPEYMVPAAFVELEALPLTTNGKVDRRALPAPADARLSLQEKFVAPHTPTEEVIAHLWEQVLGVQQVGIHDNFFLLGGHSLLAMQIASRIRSQLQVQLPLRQFFELPTVAQLAEQIDHLRTSCSWIEMPDIQPLPRTIQQLSPDMRTVTPEVVVLPMSFAQQRLWFLDQLIPNNAAYNIPATISFDGVLNRDALQQSIDTMIQRHEVLRTTFAMIDDKPVQIVLPFQPKPLTEVDLQHLQMAEREKAAHDLLEEKAAQPIDLVQGPLWHVTVVHMKPEMHMLVLVMHHSISDGWTIGLFFRELVTLYEAFSTGQMPALPDLPIQYADFAAWQQKYLRGDLLTERMAFWKQQLTNAPEALEIPTDHPRPAVPTARGSTYTFYISKELTEAVKTLCRQEEVTLYIAVVAAFQILLYRYTMQEDLIIGTAVADRPVPEVQDVMGFFLNTLVLRTDLSGNLTVRQLLKRVRDVVLDMHAYQDLPFDLLVKELQQGRSTGQKDFFQAAISLDPPTITTSTHWTLTRMASQTGATKFDLGLELDDHPDGLIGHLEYRTELFEATTIERMANHFQHLLQAMVTMPTASLATLPLLTEDEWQQIVVQWNPTRQPLLDNQCLHQHIEAQVEHAPEATAVIFEDNRLSYAQLNARANQLAHYLRRCGVGPEVLVGVAMERSLELVISLLGILKAGGAYVPLDPTYPRERLAFMLEDLSSEKEQTPFILLTQQRFVEQFPQERVQLLCLDHDWDTTIAQEPENNPELMTEPGNVAYVIYTSGSTGQPKGVMVSHSNIIRLFTATQPWFHFSSRDVWTLFHSYAFDFSVWELWGALFFGSTLVVVPYWMSRSPHDFLQLLRNEHVTVLNQTPSAFRQLQHAVLHEQGTTDLRLVIFGGEVLDFQSLKPWLEHFGDQQPQLVNMYGITETTVHVTYRPIQMIDLEKGVGNLIGQPIPDLRVYVLDPLQQPVPIGIPGEIYVGGAGVAQGYLNRKHLTQERFIPDPFSSEPGARLYKTGDRARYLENGELEYLGRLDEQVKIRGFRIELGEIESILIRHPSVREALVMAREDTPGNKRLVAYIVLSQGEADTKDLRQYLQALVPEYMIPAAFVELEAIPVTRNGKADRRALPAPADARLSLREEFVAPHTPTEETIAHLWEQVMGVQQVGIHDNFFLLGGHSLLAMQIASRIRSQLQVQLPLRQFFELPTVAQLAEQIEFLQANTITSLQPTILPVKRIPQDDQVLLLPATFAQQGLWLLDQVDPGNTAYNVSTLLRLHQPLHQEALQGSLEYLMHRHEALRTTFMLSEGEPMQHIAPTQPVQLRKESLEHVPVSQREQAALHMASQEVQRPFDLAQGPLVRFLWIELDTHEHILIIVMHHIVSDGWSMSLLVQELTALYEAFIQGQTLALPAAAIQLADFASWQREQMQGELLQRRLAYWKSYLDGAPTQLELFTDRPRTTHPSHQGALHIFQIPADISHGIKTMSQRENVTLYMTLMSAFLIVLQRYSGQDDFLVGTTSAGRSRSETESLLGYMVNTFVLRARFSQCSTVHDLLQQVREGVLAAQAHELPFDLLVKELQPDRALGRSPLFQVFLTMDTPAPAIKSAWQHVSMDLEVNSAMFDITLELAERANEIVGYLEYRTELFDAATIERLALHFQRLLTSMVADSDQPLHTLSLLTSDERIQMLNACNATVAPFPDKATLAHLFEAQVALTPDAPAVLSEQRQLSYSEINAHANQLAHYLHNLGVGTHARVGVAMERSPEMVVALLGILKAGAAYVPLDPSYPRQRLAFLISDAQLTALLTQERFRCLLPTDALDIICLDQDWTRIASESTSNLDLDVNSTALAYLIYTSGSTGTPKGVLATHRATINRLHWMWQHYPFSPEEVCCQKTTLNFVDSVWEIFGPLLQGIPLVLIPDQVVKDPHMLLASLEAYKVTRLVLVPSLLRVLLQHEDETRPLRTQLRHLSMCISSGEMLPLDVVKQFQQVLPACRLLNLYGSSEVAADATVYEVMPQQEGERVLIGRPITNMRVYVLDAQRQLVPIGVPGEIYVGGEGVAQGYWQRPELTATSFLSDPIDPHSGIRFYKTGDRGRYLPDGNLEYLGRIDHQVKLRGMRIELGEIESVLRQHAVIHEAVVIVREDTPGNTFLVAYVVFQQHQNETYKELRRHLSAYLPEYMVPAIFVTLASLPLAPNGKVDRKALPAPDTNRTYQFNTNIEPESIVQHQLLQIWEELLNIHPISIHDNFFELGGHSLLAVQLIARIEHVCGKRLPVSILFKCKTVAELANVMQSAEKEVTRTPVVAVQASGSGRPFFYLHGDASGKGFYCLKLSKALGPERPFYILEPYNYAGMKVIPSLEETATAHIEAMRKVQPEGPYLIGGWCNGALIAYEMAQQLQATNQQVEMLIIMAAGSAPKFASLLRKVLDKSSTLLHLNTETQDRLFFRILHGYEYVRLWNYRKRLIEQNRSTEEGRDPQEIELPHANFQWLFPPIEKLHENYMSIFSKIASGYKIRPYHGRLAVFWATEDDPGRRKYWTKKLEEKKDIEVYEIPGTHMTSRTRFAHVLAERLRDCLNHIADDHS